MRCSVPECPRSSARPARLRRIGGSRLMADSVALCGKHWREAASEGLLLGPGDEDTPEPVKAKVPVSRFAPMRPDPPSRRPPPPEPEPPAAPRPEPERVLHETMQRILLLLTNEPQRTVTIASAMAPLAFKTVRQRLNEMYRAGLAGKVGTGVSGGDGGSPVWIRGDGQPRLRDADTRVLQSLAEGPALPSMMRKRMGMASRRPLETYLRALLAAGMITADGSMYSATPLGLQHLAGLSAASAPTPATLDPAAAAYLATLRDRLAAAEKEVGVCRAAIKAVLASAT